MQELQSLITLQSHDAAIDELNEKAEALTPLIQKKNQDIEALKKKNKDTKDQLSKYQLRKKELELEADSKEKLVQKHQAELNSLKSNDAYKAMLSEINAAKEAVVKIEDQILGVMEAMDAAEKQLKELDQKFKADEANVRKEIQDLEGKKQVFLAEIRKKKEERDAFAATVDARLKDQYEAIRQKRGGVAIVPLKNNSCGGCHMSLTTNKSNEVKKAKSVVFCESCSRILYLLPEETAAQPPTSSGTEATVSSK